jgi:hypothetical protein
MMATSGAKINNEMISICTPSKTFAAAPEAPTPARNKSESPGKNKPINKPVSIKIMARMPISPRVEIME